MSPFPYGYVHRTILGSGERLPRIGLQREQTETVLGLDFDDPEGEPYVNVEIEYDFDFTSFSKTEANLTWAQYGYLMGRIDGFSRGVSFG